MAIDPGWRLQPMTRDDIGAAEAIRHQVGWNQTEADWLRLLALHPAGSSVAMSEGKIVGTVTTVAYGRRLGWIGMLLVDPGYRGQGIGSALLGRAIELLRDQGVVSIGLDATPAGQPLYRKIGFTEVWPLARWYGQLTYATSIATRGAEIRAPGTEDLARLIQQDRHALGVDRGELLQLLAGQSDRVLIAVDAEGTTTGFGMLRRGSRAFQMGPLVIEQGDQARALLWALRSRWVTDTIYWDIPEPNQTAVEMATSLGFRRQRSLIRMVLGAPLPDHNPLHYYAIADLATG